MSLLGELLETDADRMFLNDESLDLCFEQYSDQTGMPTEIMYSEDNHKNFVKYFRNLYAVQLMCGVSIKKKRQMRGGWSCGAGCWNTAEGEVLKYFSSWHSFNSKRSQCYKDVIAFLEVMNITYEVRQYTNGGYQVGIIPTEPTAIRKKEQFPTAPGFHTIVLDKEKDLPLNLPKLFHGDKATDIFNDCGRITWQYEGMEWHVRFDDTPPVNNPATVSLSFDLSITPLPQEPKSQVLAQ